MSEPVALELDVTPEQAERLSAGETVALGVPLGPLVARDGLLGVRARIVFVDALSPIVADREYDIETPAIRVYVRREEEEQ